MFVRGGQGYGLVAPVWVHRMCSSLGRRVVGLGWVFSRLFVFRAVSTSKSNWIARFGVMSTCSAVA